MTYKTRQEVLRAAADWIDVCEKAGIVAMCKQFGKEKRITDICPLDYEFPIALLEGKEVWVGSELFCKDGTTINVTGISSEDVLIGNCSTGLIGGLYSHDFLQWDKPKPKTVTVEMLVEDAQWWLKEDFCSDRQVRVKAACKKALEKL